MSDPQVTSTHCFRGHARTEKTTRWFLQKGRMYPKCRRCEAVVRNTRYATDPIYREWVKEGAWRRQIAYREAARQENV